MIGHNNAGKTSLYNFWMKSPQPLNTYPTVGVDFSNLKVNIGEKVLRLRIFDTAGTETFYKIIKDRFQ